MATIKIQDENGNYVNINSFRVSNINVVQTTGQDDEKVMSQKAVTDELNQRAKLIKSPNHPNFYEFDNSIIIDCGEY